MECRFFDFPLSAININSLATTAAQLASATFAVERSTMPNGKAAYTRHQLARSLGSDGEAKN
jgi:hypothetical protein